MLSDAGDDVEGGIRYVPLAAEHAAAAQSALSLAFHQGEPTTACLGVSHASHRAFFALFAPQMLGNGLSVAAVDAATGAFAGCFMAEDFAAAAPPAAETSADAHPGMGTLFAVLEDAEEAFKAGNGVGPASATCGASRRALTLAGAALARRSRRACWRARRPRGSRRRSRRRRATTRRGCSQRRAWRRSTR